MPISTDVTGWTSGPLPHDLEQIALKLFARQYPMAAWADPSFSLERNDCRRFALQLRVDFLKLDAWTIENAHQRLADEVSRLIFGDRPLGSTIREEVRDYSETFLADAWGHFSKRLFYPGDVAANGREVEAEGARG